MFFSGIILLRSRADYLLLEQGSQFLSISFHELLENTDARFGTLDSVWLLSSLAFSGGANVPILCCFGLACRGFALRGSSWWYCWKRSLALGDCFSLRSWKLDLQSLFALLPSLSSLFGASLMTRNSDLTFSSSRQPASWCWLLRETICQQLRRWRWRSL